MHFHNFLGLWGFCFWHFVKKFPQHCPNCHLRVLRNKLKKKNASKEIKNFYHRLTWRMKSWAFCPKTFSRAAKYRFCGPSPTIWETFFQDNLHFPSLSVFQSTFSGLSAEIFWQVCQFFCRKYFERPAKFEFYVSAGLFDVFWIFFKKSCQNSILLVQWRLLRGFGFEKKLIFLTFLGLWTFFFEIWQKNFHSVAKTAFHASWGIISRDDLLRKT